MQEFERSLTIHAPADEVFDYISDLQNLPNYLPTLRQAEAVDGDRIRVSGEAAGHAYEDTGFYRADRGAHRMEWGSDGESGYQGWLEVKYADTPQNCEVVVHLSFDPRNHALQQMDQQGGRQQAVNQGIENALQSIKNQCEGRGGKIESRTV